MIDLNSQFSIYKDRVYTLCRTLQDNKASDPAALNNFNRDIGWVKYDALRWIEPLYNDTNNKLSIANQATYSVIPNGVMDWVMLGIYSSPPLTASELISFINSQLNFYLEPFYLSNDERDRIRAAAIKEATNKVIPFAVDFNEVHKIREIVGRPPFWDCDLVLVPPVVAPPVMVPTPVVQPFIPLIMLPPSQQTVETIPTQTPSVTPEPIPEAPVVIVQSPDITAPAMVTPVISLPETPLRAADAVRISDEVGPSMELQPAYVAPPPKNWWWLLLLGLLLLRRS